MPLHASSTVVLIIRRSKLYYTASGIITPVGGRPVHGTATHRMCIIIKKRICSLSWLITKIILSVCQPIAASEPVVQVSRQRLR